MHIWGYKGFIGMKLSIGWLLSLLNMTHYIESHITAKMLGLSAILFYSWAKVKDSQAQPTQRTKGDSEQVWPFHPQFHDSALRNWELFRYADILLHSYLQPRSLIQVQMVYLLTMCQHMPSSFYTWPYLNLTSTLWSRYYYSPHFTDDPQRVE